MKSSPNTIFSVVQKLIAGRLLLSRACVLFSLVLQSYKNQLIMKWYALKCVILYAVGDAVAYASV